MSRLIRSLSLILPACVLSACALQHVDPAPLQPDVSETSFRTRSLADEQTRAWLAQRNIDTTVWPPQHWSPEQLVLAALERHPSTAQARARAALARAEITTAGLKPRPSLSTTLENSSDHSDGQSPWSIGLALDLAITGRSVRDARVERARLLADAAVFDEAEAAWAIRSRARAALIELWASRAELASLDELVRTWLDAQAAMQKRYELGAADALDLTTTRTAAAEAEARYVQTEQRQIRARGELAQTLALPLQAIDALELDFSEFDAPAPLPDDNTLRAATTRDRVDLRRALARHAATEAGLQLELRAQYPEIRLQPGFLWDQGARIWQLGASLPLFSAQRQAGPIAEAIARRDIAAQDFIALQAQSLAALDAARVRVQAAGRDTDSAEAELDEAQRQSTRTEQRYARGYTDRLDRLLARTRLIEAGLRVVQARARTQTSRLALEDALQRPLSATTADTFANTGASR